MEKLYIDLKENSYHIHIEGGLLHCLSDYLGQGDKYLIITDENVDRLYGDLVKKGLGDRDSYKIIIKPGEETKTLKTVEYIMDRMIEFGLTRKSKIIALGGGVVGDIAGFSASIYMRGIPFIQVPTTLLSQVDSSVGGKTGVNMDKGKNMVGSFYQPERVIIDTNTLGTLGDRELISGLGEIIKYGIIWDYEFFQYIDKNMEDILKLKDHTIKYIIKRCCEIKAQVVSKDEKELGLRKILNHGHTIGHSLEAISHYKTYTHGEAVLIGIYHEALLGRKLQLIEEDYLMEIKGLIEKLPISLDISHYPWEDLVKIMKSDKKNKEDKISFILPKGKGRVEEVLLNTP